MTSLRARLTLLSSVLVAVALVIGAFALSAVLSASRVSALDEVAKMRVSSVAALADSDRVPDVLPVTEPGEVAQLLAADGSVLATSANASRTLPIIPPVELRRLLAGADGTSVVVRSTERGAYEGESRVALERTTYAGGPAVAVAAVPMREVQGVVRALRWSLVGVVPVLTALFAVVIWLVIGWALRPVEALRRGAAAVAETGGPGLLPVPRQGSEITALARTLNEMLDRLQKSAGRQRAFVADAAHELRSPIAGLRATVDVARAHPQTYTVPELAAEADGEVARLQGLVDDLLVLARVGAVPPVRETVDLAAVVASAVAGAVVRPGVEVVVGERDESRVVQGAPATLDTATMGGSVVPGSVAAVGDPAALVRVVRNLIDNAVRHTRSTVEVTVAPGRITVDDDGPGIAADDRERVFERFTRLDESRGRDGQPGGTGLGLAIARETARDGGGDVVLGESPAGGLRATVTLPRG